jgi:capsular polysaccharide biosynthesis protein
VKKLLVLVCIALGAGLAAGYTWRSDREYSSSASVFAALEPAKAQPGALHQVMWSPSLDEYVESDAFAESVSRQLGGDVEPDALREAVAASVLPDTTIVRITATDSDRVRARDIAAAYAETLRTQESGQEDSQVVWRVIDAAEIDDNPAGRPWWRNLALGAGAGLLVGLCLALVRAVRATTP